MQLPQSYSIGIPHSSGELAGRPTGARPVYRGRWCAVSRGHPGRPQPSPPWAALGQLCTAPWELLSTGRQWNSLDQNWQSLAYRAHPALHAECLYRRSPGKRAHPALHAEHLYWMCHSGAQGSMLLWLFA
ncbi:UNVERIFIED_CONTAM: hypothetical protein FKN15_060166 [Acipenser sinensis]